MGLAAAQLALGLLAGSASAEGASVTPKRPEARPGDYCLPGGCRPGAANGTSLAAFGVAIVATLWTARRREPGSR